MKSLIPYSLIRLSLTRRLANRLAAYAMGALCAWQMISFVDIFFHLERQFINLAGIMLCSCFAPVLVWPLAWEETRKDLRLADPDSLFEALLEAPAGSVRDIVKKRFVAFSENPETLRSGRRDIFAARQSRVRRLLSREFALTLLIVFTVQLTGIVRLGHPLWGEAGVPLTSVAGGRRNTQAEPASPGAAPLDPASAERAFPNDRTGMDRSRSDRFSADDEIQNRVGADAQRDGRAGDAAPRKPELTLPSRGEERLRGNDGGDDGVKSPMPAENPSSGGKDREPGARDNTAQAPGTADEVRRGRGWEKTPDTRIPSPIVEYRSWMEKVFARHSGRTAAAIGGLRAGEIDSFERTLFESFRVPPGIQREEDPYALLLKNRWLNGKESLQ